MRWLDSLCEHSARQLARRLSRRSVLGNLGAMLVGASLVPLLPIARGAEPRGGTPGQPKADPGDPTQCDYWRYCAIDGFLCSCCGGSQHACPPGTEPSPTTWIGTCHNPADERDYIVSYNDCCGKSSCGRCLCNRNEGDMPLYAPFRSNDYDWCAGAQAGIPYNCSISRIIGVAK
jgi:methylamine dehydrogenase light chain